MKTNKPTKTTAPKTAPVEPVDAVVTTVQEVVKEKVVTDPFDGYKFVETVPAGIIKSLGTEMTDENYSEYIEAAADVFHPDHGFKFFFNTDKISAYKGIPVTVVVPVDFSNISKEDGRITFLDRRTGFIMSTNPIQGVPQFVQHLEGVARNLKYFYPKNR